MRTIWNAVLSRENGTTERPQTRRCPEIINHNSAEYGQSIAEAILNRPARRFCTGKNRPRPSCNPAGFMVQYLSIHKDVSDSACCVVRHTDAGPVRWTRCEPGQVGNQAALSSAFVRFSKPASVCRVTQGGDKTPSSAVLLFLPQRPGKGRDRRVSCTLPQVETPAV